MARVFQALRRGWHPHHQCTSSSSIIIINPSSSPVLPLVRAIHSTPIASNNLLLNNLFRFGGYNPPQQQQNPQHQQQQIPLPEDRLPKGYRYTSERSADTLSYIKDLPLADKLLVKKFINVCMHGGKKSRARNLCFEAFTRLSNHGDVCRILNIAVENVKPICEVRRVRVAGTTHNVPAAIPLHRQQSLSMRWIIEAARKRYKARPGMGMPKALADELYDASKKAGGARKKRDDLHRLAETNRTLAHYRWW